MPGQTLTAGEAALEELVSGGAQTEVETQPEETEEVEEVEDAQLEETQEEQTETEDAPVQPTRPELLYQHGASLLPSEDDEQVFVTRGDLKRIVTDAIREHSQARNVVGSHMQTIADEAPAFYRHYASDMEAALEDLPDPRVRARKESVNYAAGAAIARRIAQGANYKDVILEAADLIRGQKTTPAKKEPNIIREADPRRAVPSPSSGRSTATVAASTRTQRSGGGAMSKIEKLFPGISAEETPELY